MVALFLALSVASSPADAVFDAAIEAHRKADRASVSIVVDSKLKGKAAETRFRLAYVRPGAMRLEAEEVKPLPSTRTFYLSGERIVAYDHDSNEVVRQKVSTRGSLVQRAARALGHIEEAVETVVDPNVSKALFARFRAVKNWQVSTQRGLVVLRMRAAKGTVRFAFDVRSHLLREFAADGADGVLRWSLRYGPAPASVGYSPPAYAKPVGHLSARTQPPKYADAQARHIAVASERAYDRLRQVEFEVDSGVEAAHVWFSDGKMCERNRSVVWGFDGHVLWIVKAPRRAAWMGDATAESVGACLAALDLPTDAYVLQLLQRRNPMRQILVPGADVHTVGTVKLNGCICDILEVAAPSLRISACVRRSDHLPAQVTSENLDDSGHKLAGSDRRIRYFSVGVPIPVGRFRSQIPPGVAPAKLPKVR